MTYCASPKNLTLLDLKHFRAFVLNEVLFYFVSFSLVSHYIDINILSNNLNLQNKVVQTKMAFLELSWKVFLSVLCSLNKYLKWIK